MKRLGYFAGIIFVALCLFASAYGERNKRGFDRGEALTQQQESLLIEAELDELAERMNQLKSQMAADRLELIKSGKATRHSSPSR